MCSPPLLLITKVWEEAWGSMHLNIFFRHLLGGVCPRGLESCLDSPAGEFICLQPTVESTFFHEVALKINYAAEVRGKNKGRSICVRASGQPHGAAGENTGNAIYHRDSHYTNTRSGFSVPQLDL